MTLQEYYDRIPAFRGKQAAVPEFPDYYFCSGFVHPKLPVLTSTGIEMQRWGLIPSWARDEQSALEIRGKTLNAVSETVFEKPSYKASILSRRAILPVTGFFEWRDVQKVKYPYFVRFAHGQSMPVGAIWDHWLNHQTGQHHHTFSILTTAANPMMEMIHNTKKRMPLVLDENSLAEWLNPEAPISMVEKIMKPCPDDWLQSHTISRKVNNLRENHNRQEILAEVRYPEIDYLSGTLF